MRFGAFLFTCGVPTKVPPFGGRGRNILLTDKVIDKLISDYVSKPVWTDQAILGEVDRAGVMEGRFYIEGVLHRFPALKDHPLGISYDLKEAHVANKSRSVWEIHKAEVSGANVIYQRRAAHQEHCSFWIING